MVQGDRGRGLALETLWSAPRPSGRTARVVPIFAQIRALRANFGANYRATLPLDLGRDSQIVRNIMFLKRRWPRRFASRARGGGSLALSTSIVGWLEGSLTLHSRP